MIRKWFFEFLIGILQRELSDIPRETLTKEAYDGLMSQLWQSPAFRKYVADRDAKLIFTMASGEGFDPEPRDKYLIHFGRRMENLELAREAKQAYNRLEAMRKQKVVQ
ncbi:MAG: hypothetical protein Q7S52_05385 [bacterium]|nr:hypothetical protein [bacterium]